MEMLSYFITSLRYLYKRLSRFYVGMRMKFRLEFLTHKILLTFSLRVERSVEWKVLRLKCFRSSGF